MEKDDMVSRGSIAPCWPNMSVYKWKGSGLESQSLQFHELMAVAEGSQMGAVRACVVTGLAVLTWNHCCNSPWHFQAPLCWWNKCCQCIPRGRLLMDSYRVTQNSYTFSWAVILAKKHKLYILWSTLLLPTACTLLHLPQWHKLFLNTQSTRLVEG